MLPFLAAFIDFDSSEETFQRYDKMSAYELFKMCGVSKVKAGRDLPMLLSPGLTVTKPLTPQAAYEEFLKPTLLVGLFAPPEQISAACMLEALYFYALAHQNDFDVCWCK